MYQGNYFLGLALQFFYAITADCLVHRSEQTIQLDHEMGNNP